MNKGMKTTLIVFMASIFVIVTGFFLLGFEHNSINITALCFLIFSLLVSMFSIMSLTTKKQNKDTLFYNAGIGSITGIYQVVVLITVLIAKVFENNIKTFVFLQIIINALLFIAYILIVTASSHINNSNQKTLEKKNNGDYNQPKRGGF